MDVCVINKDVTGLPKCWQYLSFLQRLPYPRLPWSYCVAEGDLKLASTLTVLGLQVLVTLQC